VLNIPRPEGAAAQSLIDELRGWVRDQLSPIAKPGGILLTDNLPKTRSGKIMRRLLRSLAARKSRGICRRWRIRGFSSSCEGRHRPPESGAGCRFLIAVRPSPINTDLLGKKTGAYDVI
jgi:hypothetical protein